jgi:hypothetical protein
MRDGTTQGQGAERWDLSASVRFCRTRPAALDERRRQFAATRSGRTHGATSLEALLAYARSGDTLAVVRLDRLGRSLGKLLAMMAMLKERHRLLSLGGKDRHQFRCGRAGLRAAASLARLRRDLGRRAEARDLLAPVYGWFTEASAHPT